MKREKNTFSVPLPFTRSRAPSAVSKISKLTNRDIDLSLVGLVLIPYGKVKLDELYDNLSGGAAAQLLGNQGPVYDVPSDATGRQKLVARLKYWFQILYPYANCTYHLSYLLFNILYLFGHSRYHSPWLAFIKVGLFRLTGTDLV